MTWSENLLRPAFQSLRRSPPRSRNLQKTPAKVARRRSQRPQDHWTPSTAWRRALCPHSAPDGWPRLRSWRDCFLTSARQFWSWFLQGCSGDLVKAIEHFLSAGEAAKNGGSVSRSELAHSSSEKDAHSYRAPSSHPSVPGLGSSMFRSPLHVDKLGVGSLKSAFTPLPPATTSALPLLFSHRPPNPFQTDAFLGRTPLFAPTGLSDIHASAASPGRFIFPAMHPLNLSGKLAAAAASDAYPRYLFAPYASCPPDCTQYPGLHGTRAPGGSTGSDSEKSPGAIADLSVTSNVDSDWGFVIYVCIRLRRI